MGFLKTLYDVLRFVLLVALIPVIVIFYQFMTAQDYYNYVRITSTTNHALASTSCGAIRFAINTPLDHPRRADYLARALRYAAEDDTCLPMLAALAEEKDPSGRTLHTIVAARHDRAVGLTGAALRLYSEQHHAAALSIMLHPKLNLTASDEYLHKLRFPGTSASLIAVLQGEVMRQAEEQAKRKELHWKEDL